MPQADKKGKIETIKLKRVTWFIAYALFSFLHLPAQQLTENRGKSTIVLGRNADPLISIGVDRIIKKSEDAPVDIFHSDTYETATSDDYTVSIILETYDSLTAKIKKMIPEKPATVDAFTVKTINKNPLTIVGTGYNARGTMYSAYKIAEMIEMGSSLDNIDELNSPKVDDRIVYLKYDVSEGVATVGPQSGRRRQNFTSKSLRELPLYGVNGILMTDHPVAPWFPFEISDSLTYKIEPQATDLKAIFEDIDQYGMDIYLHYPYFLLPDYSFEEIEEYLRGDKDIPGFIDYYKKYHEKRLEALFRFFPEIDGLDLGGPEGTVGYISKIPSNGILKDTHSDERSLLILENYLKVVQKVAKKYNKKTLFWTHNWGQTSVQIKELREMLYTFPDIGVLEDAHWSNMGWATLPTMGYLSDDLQRDVGKYNDYYMMTFTDGEGLGGGVLPNSIPEPLYNVSQEIIDRNFKGIVSRIDIQDKTSLGSLFDMNEINFIAGMAPLWTPTKSLEEVWENWVIRRFGREAAPALLPVLKSSKEIILKGYMIAGVPLMYHSRFEPKSWLGEWHGGPDFRRLDLLLIKPGTPMLTEEDKDTISSGEYYAYQLDLKAANIIQVRKDQARALELCRHGVEVIEKLKEKLKPVDYDYLLTTYNTAFYVMDGLQAATEVLYYDNIHKDNFDDVQDPEKELKKALEGLDTAAVNIRSQVGTAHFDQDFYYLPGYLVEYGDRVEKTLQNHPED